MRSLLFVALVVLSACVTSASDEEPVSVAPLEFSNDPAPVFASWEFALRGDISAASCPDIAETDDLRNACDAFGGVLFARTSQDWTWHLMCASQLTVLRLDPAGYGTFTRHERAGHHCAWDVIQMPVIGPD